MRDTINKYLSGEFLYGDDLSPEEIDKWYRDEGEGYADLGASNSQEYRYVYHALNAYHGFGYLDNQCQIKILGFGSAYGDELAPVLDGAGSLTIIDPSDAFVQDEIRGVPCQYIKPVSSGELPFKNNEFDLVTIFGVLHHVPNVTVVLKELARVLKPGGYMLLREPIVSMGDWRKPRPGLTMHERGIPLTIMRRLIQQSGLQVKREGMCAFPPLTKLYKLIRSDVYNSRVATILDDLLSRIFSWNINYHPEKWWQKIRPTSAFYVLHKPLDRKIKGI